MPNVQLVSLKFKGQRKAQEYVVYPKNYSNGGDDGKLYFQSDKACGYVNPQTGETAYSRRGSYFAYLAIPGNRETFVMDATDVAKLQAAQVQPGDRIGAGVYVA